MEKKLILFLSANPKDPDYDELHLIRECNDVADKIRYAKHGNEVDFRQHHAISLAKIQEIIADTSPQIVHFTGHGEKEHLVLEGINEQTEHAKAKALANMFKLLNKRKSLAKEKKILCVVLSACYSRQIAKALAEHVDFVVGMSNEVEEDTAKIFAEHFYYHLCSGESFGDAFEFGKSQIALLGIPGQDIPKLEKRNDIDPSTVFLFAATKKKPDLTITTLELDQKYRELITGRTTVREFWEDEARGGLLNILLYFSVNYRAVGMSEGEKNSIDTIISHVPPKLHSRKEAHTAGNHTLRDQLDGQIRGMYGDALDILRKYRAPSGISPVERIEPYQAGSREFDQNPIRRLLLDLLDVMEKVSLINATATRCVMESNIPNNMLSIVNTAHHGADQCQNLSTDYGELSENVDTLLPPGRCDRAKVQGASDNVKVQILNIGNCFRAIAANTNVIVSEVGSLRSNYRQYCEITISEILAAKGLG